MVPKQLHRRLWFDQSFNPFRCMQETFELLELIRNNDDEFFTAMTTSKYDQVMIFLSPRHVIPSIAIFKGLTLSIYYFTKAFHHLNFPGKQRLRNNYVTPVNGNSKRFLDFIVYSIVYDEKSDSLSMLLGDTSTVWKCFRPAPFYITIRNPSQIDFDFEFDEVTHGKFEIKKIILSFI